LRLLKIARSYLRQAEARLKYAQDSYKEGNYPYSVRLSQECVELCLKAVLKAVGVEYPRVHDVSDVLLDFKNRFPEWFQKELNYLSESSKVLAKKREPSFYGIEEDVLAPEEVMDEEDARDAVDRAVKTFYLCRKLVDELKKSIH
jgi:HEPN domain-containing protein